jgi:hypothetical protein
MTARPLRPASLWLLCVAVLIRPSWAQEPPAPSDVFVEDSPEAAQALAALAAMESQRAGTGQWRRAAITCQEIRQRYGSKLLRLDQNRYTSVATHLAARIRTWPAEGLAQYEALLEPQARHLLAQARARPDLPQLLKVADDYVCTPSGTAAADLAADLALEAGRFDLAASVWSDLLQAPQPDPLRTNFSLKLLACHVLAGRGIEAESLAAQILAGAADQQVTWQGRPQPVSQVAHDLLAHQPPSTRPLRPTPITWPAGAPGPETQPAPAGLNPEVLLWSFPTAHHQDAAPARFAPLPVVCGDRVYVQGPFQAWALDLDSGTAVWTYTAPSPRPTQGDMPSITALPSRPALAGGRLYACFGPPSADSSEPPSSTLVCLDAATGQELWGVNPDESDPAGQDLRLDPCPLYYDGQLYVVARRPTSARLQAAYLLQLDAATGRLIWRTHIGSAPVRRPADLQIAALATAADDVVYVHSNGGTVAALTAHNGQVRWLYRYDRPEPASGVTSFCACPPTPRRSSSLTGPTATWPPQSPPPPSAPPRCSWASSTTGCWSSDPKPSPAATCRNSDCSGNTSWLRVHPPAWRA